MIRLQEWIHRLEVGEGTRLVRLLTAVLAFAGLAVLYDLLEYRNFSTQEAMDAGQLARNLAEGEGFTTDFVRPFSLWLVERKQTQLRQRTNDLAILRSGHPDLANAPVYPLVLCGLMKALPFDHTIPQGVFFQRYQPEVLIAFFNQLLFFLAVVMVFQLAKRLFDPTVAWVSALIFAGSDLMWRFSVSGLSTLLLLVIFLSLVWCLVVMEEAARLERRGGGWFVFMAAMAGLLLGVGTLTRYAFGWLMIPVGVFLLACFPRRRAAMTLTALLVFAATLTPWVVRNYQLAGVPFGTAGYALFHGTEQFPAERLERSMKPDFSDMTLEDVFRKLTVNLGELVQNDLLKLGGSWIGAFFLVGLLVPFVNPGLSRLRLFLVVTLVILAVAQALGRTQLSNTSPEINSENLLMLLIPWLAVFGVATYSLVLDQLKLPFPQLRHLVTGIVIVFACAPLIFRLLPPRSHPVAYPPYYPPLIRNFSLWMQERELVMSDMPWAVAWYGNRQSIWTTLLVQDSKSQNDFYAINDYRKPVGGLYLTQLTMDGTFYSQMLKGQDWAWGRFVMDSLMRTNMPAGFPLGHASAGFLENGQLFLTDRPRWRGRGGSAR